MRVPGLETSRSSALQSRPGGKRCALPQSRRLPSRTFGEWVCPGYNKASRKGRGLLTQETRNSIAATADNSQSVAWVLVASGKPGQDPQHPRRSVRAGADGGFSALGSRLASILAGDGGAVWAFEPEPHNAAFLRRHIRLNGRRNVHVEELAVCDVTGTARFDRGTGSGTGHLAEDGELEVRTVRLADFCAARNIRPTALKIDVEGAEESVLEGARELISTFRPIIFLSTHGYEPHRRSLAFVRAAGYAVFPILGGDVESTCEILCLPDGTVA